jgi:hypothetical protein
MFTDGRERQIMTPNGIAATIRRLKLGKRPPFSHGLIHVNATKLDGGQLDMWWRTTVCFRRIDNKWMITHQHASSSIPQRRRMFASVFDSIAAGIS